MDSAACILPIPYRCHACHAWRYGALLCEVFFLFPFLALPCHVLSPIDDDLLAA